ncbi:hypothetical protein MSG28_011327 [Choristoneura fumiferana]|uniref:Uncharacterized protein n=1 Tax=Choristoneura fumiferana TaxID=7141 RepID=A0ACC0JMX9_CHOFU|nr:hypothetical protein MSG28_011327 [Choristoneura fumiferana]
MRTPPCSKWRAAKGPALSVGTVVLIKDDQLPPCHWRMGRITECHDGRGGITRVATIKTQRATIKRTFNTICVLPINDVD